MAPRTLSFATALTPDPPLQQTARYNFDAQDRQSIDNQIRATQTFLSADVINGKSGTYVTFVGDDGAVGDIVCSAGGLGGKPTVRLATAETLALSGVMFGILVESCVEGNKAHVIHSGIVGPEITGLAAGDEGWVRVSANRCEKVSVLLDEDICVGWVDPGGFLRIGAQPIASVTGAAPTAAKYLIAAATVPGELTQAVAAQALSSTFLFASASVAPLQLRRTSGTTDADVDVGYLEALSSSTTAAGFGPALRLYAKRGSGGAETTGTISIVWTNVSGGSEATKAVIKTRSAGGAPATAMEVSETAVKITALAGSGKRAVTVESDGSLGSDTGSGLDSATHVLEDATTALNANGVPTRQMSSALTFGRVGAAGSSSGPLVFRRLITGGAAGTTGTAVEIPFEMPDSTPTQRQVGRIRYEWTDPTALDPHASIILSNLGTDGEHDWLTIASDGAMRWHGGAYAHNGYRPVFDASGNIGASVISFSEVKTALAAANSSISVNSQKITGVTAGASSGEAVEYSQLATAVNAAVSGTTNRVPKIASANTLGDSSISDDGTTVSTTEPLAVNIAGIATTSTVGFTLAESTASSAGTTVRRSPFMTWTGHAWISGADKTMRVTAEVRPRTSTNVDIYFQYDTGSGTLSDLFFVSTSTSAGFWQALSCFTFEVSSGGNGYRFAGGSQGGLSMDGSGHIHVKSGGTQRVELISSIGAATNADGVRIWNDTTRSAGNIVGFGTGASYTSKAAVAYDGTWNGPVLRNTASKTGTYTASLFELVEYSPAGGTFTVTLPSPVAGATGQLLVTKNIGSSGIPLSVATPSGNIDNAATVAIAGGYASDTMVSDGANGWLRISALRPWNFTAVKTANYTTAIGEVVKCDPSGAGFNVDLPAVPTTNTMREIDIIVKNVTSSTNTITIRPNGSDTIDGAANTTITTARGVVRLLALPGGTDWLIV